MNDKVVIITSGSSGIGKATALSFAAKGVKAIVAYAYTSWERPC
jgi:NAD(P)-dependent dehydrogenase (short-subunit alcohol dehydrogenase family)